MPNRTSSLRLRPAALRTTAPGARLALLRRPEDLQRLRSAGPGADRVASARYSQLPLANIGADAPLAMADMACPPPAPQPPGALGPRQRPAGPRQPRGDGERSGLRTSRARRSHSGAYRGICVELELYALAVNAVLAAPALEELEGAMMGLELDPQRSRRGGVGGGGARGRSGTTRPVPTPSAC